MCERVIGANGIQAYIGEGIEYPLYEINEAIKLMEEFNVHNESKMHYSEGNDAFWMAESGAKEFTIWKGRNYETADGIKHLYDIGRR